MHRQNRVRGYKTLHKMVGPSTHRRPVGDLYMQPLQGGAERFPRNTDITAQMVETEGTDTNAVISDFSLDSLLPTVLFLQLQETNLNARGCGRRARQKAFRNHPA